MPNWALRTWGIPSIPMPDTAKAAGWLLEVGGGSGGRGLGDYLGRFIVVVG